MSTIPIDKWFLSGAATDASSGGRRSPGLTENLTPAHVPGTVLSVQVDNAVVADPRSGRNLEAIPGFPERETLDHFATRPIPADSPYRHPRWWVGAFRVDRIEPEERLELVLRGINYRADVWINDQQIADRESIAGTYRTFELPISSAVREGPNQLALLIYPPKETDLAFSFVDWHPMPPDKCTGPWRAVEIRRYVGGVKVGTPAVRSRLSDDNRMAKLTVTCPVTNISDETASVSCRAETRLFTIERRLSIPPGETVLCEFVPRDFAELRIPDPPLWWPRNFGTPHLDRLRVTATEQSGHEQSQEVDFGIREITSFLDNNDTRQFVVNGRPLLVRGAAWAPDLLLRESREKDEIDVFYLTQMHLNALRFEGNFGSDHLWDLCDREGILVFAGWTCDSAWENYDTWTDEHRWIADESLRSVLERFRHHACFAAFIYGSDLLAPPDVEEMYLATIADVAPWIVSVASAGDYDSPVTGKTGMKMSGPYSYIPPVYWYTSRMPGFATGFNTETGPDVSIAPVESLHRAFGRGDIDTHSDVWELHTALRQFRGTEVTERAVAARYGPVTSALDLSRKAQVLAYEAWRAMYEAYARFRPESSGVIGWMLTNAWMSNTWHLYDSQLYPTGGFFGAMRACEPVHIQYDYRDRSIWVHNNRRDEYCGCEATIELASIHADGRPTVEYLRRQAVEVPQNDVVRVCDLPTLSEVSAVYFLFLELHCDGRLLSRNRYWLSAEEDILSDNHVQFGTTEVSHHADMSRLTQLERVTLECSCARRESAVELTITNPQDRIAFFVQVWLKSEETDLSILPLSWSDNCLVIKPDERITLTLTPMDSRELDQRLYVAVEGCNVARESVPVRPTKEVTADEAE